MSSLKYARHKKSAKKEDFRFNLTTSNEIVTILTKMTDINEEPTHSQPKDIERVSKETVHKICSSQVILNLAIATKELVENSVDAGSKVIEIKFKEYGLEGFEVIDNGVGIVRND